MKVSPGEQNALCIDGRAGAGDYAALHRTPRLHPTEKKPEGVIDSGGNIQQEGRSTSLHF